MMVFVNGQGVKVGDPMKHYSEELKAALIQKRLPPQHVPVGQLARETGIPKDTARIPGARRLARPAG